VFETTHCPQQFWKFAQGFVRLAQLASTFEQFRGFGAKPAPVIALTWDTWQFKAVWLVGGSYCAPLR
jgi:hypothetical protein